MTARAKYILWETLEWVILLMFPLAGLFVLLSIDPEPPEAFAEAYGPLALGVGAVSMVGFFVALLSRGACVERIEKLAPDRWEKTFKDQYASRATIGIEKALKKLVIEGVLDELGDPLLKRAFVRYQVIYWTSVPLLIAAVVFLFWIGWLEQ